MGGSSFDLIMQEVFNQKQRMEELLEENRDLRRQLAELSEGRGIFLEICGKKFALVGEPVVASPQAEPASQDVPAIYQETASKVQNEAPMNAFPETPLPSNDEFEQTADYLDHEVEEVQEEAGSPVHASTFLEDMLVDEFAEAATSQLPVAIWQGSETKQSAPIDEEEKATLRKELIGSFLLE